MVFHMIVTISLMGDGLSYDCHNISDGRWSFIWLTDSRISDGLSCGSCNFRLFVLYMRSGELSDV